MIAIIASVKQLITRIDESLHRRLRERADVEGRSMNAVVTDLLERGLNADDARARLRARARELGVLVDPPKPTRPVPTLDDLLGRTPPAIRRAVIAQFDEDRKHR